MQAKGAPRGVWLSDLRSTSCRWPLGGPWDHVEFFCGEPTLPGCSWCKEHRERAFARATGSVSGERRPFVLKDRRPPK
jgi:hypothetical protein